MPQRTQIVGTGANSGIEGQVDLTHLATRTSIRPIDYGTGGGFSISLQSGVMAAGLAAGSPILAFQWTVSAAVALIRRLRLTAGTDTTAFAQGSTIFDVIRATAFTVQDTGGVAVTIGAGQKRATKFGTSLVGNAGIRVSSTAALVAGTRTLDPNPMASLVGSVGAVPLTLASPPPGLLWEENPGRYPLNLIQSEGFIIRATVPATGTWKFAIDIDWEEVASF